MATMGFTAICSFAFVSLTSLQPTRAASKTATLDTTTSTANGASANMLSDTTVQSNEWKITDSTGKTGWAMRISLDSTWGFHPTIPSIINFTMHGTTATETTQTGALVMSFSVSNATYWSTVLSTDPNNGWYNRIGPSCDNKSTPTQQLYDGDVKAIVDANSGPYYRDIACGAWIEPFDDFRNPDNEWQPMQNVMEWPVTITIENDPIQNLMFVHVLQATYTQSCGFGEAFPPDQGLQIYFSSDGPAKQLAFNAFDIHYFYDPTESPTKDPTSTPTGQPSSSPTETLTTAGPTTNPTSLPSDHPSVSPTKTTKDPTTTTTTGPTSTPTSLHSKIPSVSLTTNPTTVPSSTPITIATTLLRTSSSTNDQGEEVEDTNQDEGDPTIPILIGACCLFLIIICCLLCGKKCNQNKLAYALKMAEHVSTSMASPSSKTMPNGKDQKFPIHSDEEAPAPISANAVPPPRKKRDSNSADAESEKNDEDKVVDATAEKKAMHEEIRGWLDTFGMENYLGHFVMNRYESMSFIKTIESMQQLQDIGVMRQDHQRLILTEIEKLREKEPFAADDRYQQPPDPAKSTEGAYKSYDHERDEKHREAVRVWLRDQVGLSAYYDQFVSNGYEKMDIVKVIRNTEMLIEIGIINEDHQRVILTEIEKLRKHREDITNALLVQYNVSNEEEEEVVTAHTHVTPKGNDDP